MCVRVCESVGEREDCFSIRNKKRIYLYKKILKSKKIKHGKRNKRIKNMQGQ